MLQRQPDVAPASDRLDRASVGGEMMPKLRKVDEHAAEVSEGADARTFSERWTTT
jgi:hypothetical protein